MSEIQRNELEPFYFKSYDQIIGIARNVNDFHIEFARLAEESPEALAYHLKEGHIVNWLDYANEKELAAQLKGVENVGDARLAMDKYFKSSKRSNKSPPRNREKHRKNRRESKNKSSSP
jgi:hypothetical protein